jgi:hypothetical protein
VGQNPGFSRRTGNFIDFPLQPPFFQEKGKENQTLVAKFP